MKGLQWIQKKVEAILQWPLPSSVKKLRGLFGLVGYYRHFVRDFGKISKPLHEMLMNDGFKWIEASYQAFQKLKMVVSTSPVLALPDFIAEFTFETDALWVGVGVVLLQMGQPIAFMSKSLSLRNQLLLVYEREMLAIVNVVQKWSLYLVGRHFKVRTDHQSLKLLMEQKISTLNH